MTSRILWLGGKFLGWLAENFCQVLDTLVSSYYPVIVLHTLSFRVLSQSRQSLENRFLASIYQYMFCLQFYPAYTSKLVAFLDRLGEEVRGWNFVVHLYFHLEFCSCCGPVCGPVITFLYMSDLKAFASLPFQIILLKSLLDISFGRLGYQI